MNMDMDINPADFQLCDMIWISQILLNRIWIGLGFDNQA